MNISLNELKAMPLKDRQKLLDMLAVSVQEHSKWVLETAVEEVREVAKKHGVEWKELLEALLAAPEDAPKKGRSARAESTGVAKYRNPENPEQTWTGRGRKPAWFTELVDAGISVASLEIK